MNNITQEEQERIKQTMHKLLGTYQPTYDDFINNKNIILNYIDGYIEGKLYSNPNYKDILERASKEFFEKLNTLSVSTEATIGTSNCVTYNIIGR